MGLGHLAQLTQAEPVRRIDYHEMSRASPRRPKSHQPTSSRTIGSIDGVPVVVYPGRVHLYQGYSAAEVTSLVRRARLGCRDVIFACATGYIPGNAHKGLRI